jgi:hypothetical protein
VRSGRGDDTVEPRIVADRLAHVLGQHQPRRAAGSGGPAEVRWEPEADAQRVDDQTRTAIDLGEAQPRARPSFSRLHVGVVCSLVLLGLVRCHGRAKGASSGVGYATESAGVSFDASAERFVARGVDEFLTASTDCGPCGGSGAATRVGPTAAWLSGAGCD